MKVKAPKKFKNKLGQRQLATQEDYYNEATEYEEQAERWILSDIRKTLRFYVQALELYEKGLDAPEATAHNTYSIMYNETRLFLQVYTDYLANNGYINLLQYVRLDDIPNVSQLALPLNEIVRRFELVNERFPNERTWDLDSNLLTCYLILIESAESYNLTGEDIVKLTGKFINVSQRCIENQFSELKSWNGGLETDESNYERDSLGSEGHARDGTGVLTNSHQQGEMSESMEIADQITTDTLSEALSNSFKFIQSLIEIITDARLENTNPPTITSIQLNYLEDLIGKYTLQLKDVYQTVSKSLTLDDKHIHIVLEANKGTEFIANADMHSLEEYVNETLNSPDVSAELLLAKVDVLNFALASIEGGGDLSTQWNLCSLLNSLLTRARKILAESRVTITAKMSAVGDQLSSVVFQQADVFVTSSDNELRRWKIKRAQDQESNSNSKTMDILMKNAKTFLINASKVAERPCGLEENIIDKLKRNYVYNQAQARLAILEGRGQATESSDISELFTDHPFYKDLTIPQ